MKNIALLIFAASLFGCIPYPIYKTLQPNAEVTVYGSGGEPIESAEVTLISGAHPYRREKSRDTQITNESGKVRFRAMREWRTEALMIHGAESFYWHWCIKKPGYETIQTGPQTKKEFERYRSFNLQPGTANDCYEAS